MLEHVDNGDVENATRQSLIEIFGLFLRTRRMKKTQIDAVRDDRSLTTMASHHPQNGVLSMPRQKNQPISPLKGMLLRETKQKQLQGDPRKTMAASLSPLEWQ
jgi:hypothetical protein